MWRGIQDGHGENVRESLKQVHYDYKNRLGSMMRKFSWMLLVLLAFSVYAEDEDLLVVGSAKELKGITAKKIIWKKDGAKMVVIPANSSGTRTTVVEATYDNFGDLVTSKKKLIVRATDAFYMDAYEVTVGQFKKFLKASGYKPDYPINWNQVYEYSPTEKHPMILLCPSRKF